MTRNEARILGKVPGFSIRVNSDQGRPVYLADYRSARHHTTPYTSQAEWFATFEEAVMRRQMLQFDAGGDWIVTTVPDAPNPLIPDRIWESLDPFQEALDTLEGEDSDAYIRTAWGKIRRKDGNQAEPPADYTHTVNFTPKEHP